MNRHGEIANSSLAVCMGQPLKRSNTSPGVTVLAFVAGGVLGLASTYRLRASIPKTRAEPSGRVTAARRADAQAPSKLTTKVAQRIASDAA